MQSNVVKLLPVDHDNTFDKILDYVPDLMEKLNCMMNKCLQNKKLCIFAKLFHTTIFTQRFLSFTSISSGAK